LADDLCGILYFYRHAALQAQMDYVITWIKFP
jgi:hypothetical protein